MEIREALREDIEGLLDLYTQLHDNHMPQFDEKLEGLWSRILSDENHHVLVGIAEEQIVASCVVVIVPNLTRSQRPYALVENVITHEGFRKRGYASRLLDRAKELAERENCYKIMLMTGSKEDSTLKFYERAGYNREDKTAFIQWLSI